VGCQEGEVQLGNPPRRFSGSADGLRRPARPIFEDEEHSEEEQPEIIIGNSVKRRLILVCLTVRDRRIRVISARRATPVERKDYEENVGSQEAPGCKRCDAERVPVRLRAGQTQSVRGKDDRRRACRCPRTGCCCRASVLQTNPRNILAGRLKSLSAPSFVYALTRICEVEYTK